MQQRAEDGDSVGQGLAAAGGSGHHDVLASKRPGDGGCLVCKQTGDASSRQRLSNERMQLSYDSSARCGHQVTRHCK
jgi:hypothetical protein